MKYMAERGYSVFGVDNDQRQIQAAADANMPVSNEDAISFLRRHEDIRWDRLQSCHRTYPRWSHRGVCWIVLRHPPRWWCGDHLESSSPLTKPGQLQL